MILSVGQPAASPRLMDAVVFRRQGEAREVLQLERIPVPECAPGDVLVKVTLSGVNPTDWKVRSGFSGPMRFEFAVPHQDGVGIVADVGKGVDRGRIGQRVWVYQASYERPWGTAAQYSLVRERQAVPVPEGIDDELAASLGVPAMTAHYALLKDGPIAGQTVLVAGGGGQVGHFAVELAKRAGAQVIATVGSDDHARQAREAGADAVLSYRDPDLAQQVRQVAPGGVERILEVAPSANAVLDAQVLAQAGRIVIYAPDLPRLELETQRLMGLNAHVDFMLLYLIPDAAKAAAVSDITDALSEGALTRLPSRYFSLEETWAAQDAVRIGGQGKILVRIPS